MNNYKFKTIFFSAFLIGFTVIFFCKPELISSGVRSGISMCIDTVIPSLFPFMVVSDFVVSSGLGSAVGNKFSLITEKIFKLPGCASCVILMSLVGGFPVGARMTASLVEEKYLTEKQGQRMLLFCVNSGPAFAVSAVGASMLGSKNAGIFIYISLVLSSIIIAIFSRFFCKENSQKIIPTSSEISGGVIVDSVKKSVSAMLSICAWVVLFSCVGNVMSIIPLNKKIKAIIFSLLEVTNGCAELHRANLSMLIAGAIGWSGIAVHCQVFEFLQKCKMPYIKFLLGRIANAVLSNGIWLLFLKFFPCEISVFSNFTNPTAQPFSISFSAGISVIILAAFLIADNDLARNKKV